MDFSNLDRVPDIRKNWMTVAEHVEGEVKRLKSNLYHVIEEKKINLKPLAAEKKRLANKTHALNEKAKEICNKINIDLKKNVENCLDEITSHVSQLEDNEISLHALNQVVSIHALVLKSHELLSNKLFYDCWNALCEAKQLIASCTDLQNLTAFTQICNQVDKVEKNLKAVMDATWAECVQLKESREANETIITVTVIKKNLADMTQIIQTVYQMDDKSLMEKFLENVRYKILLPQISSESKIETNLSTETANLEIIIDKSSNAPHYLKAFESIRATLDFFHTHVNIEIPNHVDLFHIMGQSMAEELTEKLIENCLTQVILNQQTETLGNVVASAEQLESSLKRMGFLSKDVSIMATGGTDLLLSNMIYGFYLERARNIMKKKTLNHCKLEFRQLSETFSEEDKKFADTCSASICVSVCCKEILDLVDNIVQEINTGGDSYGLRHLNTICNIFEMFNAIMPLYWKKIFETTPRHVVMFHNSCLYFAHVLLCLASDCRNSWPSNLSDKYVRLLDQSRELRKLAKESLKKCVSKKRIEIISAVKLSGLATIQESPKLDPTCENAVRQSIRLLEGFSMSIETLPDKVYINTMGFLIDEFTETLVSLVCWADDISAMAASELLVIFNLVSERVPKLFSDPNETVRLCRKWMRFEELKIILSANMEKFRQRWASGMGPISNSFSKEEASHLLRALFSNTTARSALLAEISKYKN